MTQAQSQDGVRPCDRSSPAGERGPDRRPQLVAAVWRELRRRARRLRNDDAVLRERSQARGRRARAAGAAPRRDHDGARDRNAPRFPSSPEHVPRIYRRRLAESRTRLGLRRPCRREAVRSRPLRPQRVAREKARAAFRRPSIPVASVGFGRGASYLSPASITRGLGRRRGMRVPFARLWRFPSGSRGHASTRWYLHCRYCWNLSRPDHLLSAVRPNVYRERWTTASAASRTRYASTTTMPSSRTRTGYVSTGM